MRLLVTAQLYKHDNDLQKPFYKCTLTSSHLQQLFWDETSGGYFTSPEGDASIVLRLKEDQVGAHAQLIKCHIFKYVPLFQVLFRLL